MAKRGSTRRAQTGDDEFAWQTPDGEDDAPKKKKKKSKTTGKSKSAAGDDSARSSKGSLKNSSSTRKKASGKSSARRKRESGDDEDFGEGSTRRKRATPAPKKGVDPVIPISIISVTLLICLGIFLMNRGPQKIKTDENKEFEAAKKMQEEGMTAFKEFNKAKKSGPPDMVVKKGHEATQKLQKAMDMMNAVLDKYRDKEGMLPPNLEGYERDMSEIGTILVDIEKSGQLR
ncbi:MAG: hypothetical protein AB7N76_31750 [Planctomycetota bacterium]